MTVSTFTIASSGADGYAYRYQGGGFPPTNAFVDTTAVDMGTEVGFITGTDYIISNGLMRWDTSAIPDTDVIASAILRVRVTTITNPDTRSLGLAYYDPGNPLGTYNYTGTYDASGGVATLASITTGYFDIPLISPDANINKTGFTGLRGTVSGSTPTGRNQVRWATYDNISGYNPPQLVVTHAPASTPKSATLALPVGLTLTASATKNIPKAVTMGLAVTLGLTATKAIAGGNGSGISAMSAMSGQVWL